MPKLLESPHVLKFRKKAPSTCNHAFVPPLGGGGGVDGAGGAACAFSACIIELLPDDILYCFCRSRTLGRVLVSFESNVKLLRDLEPLCYHGIYWEEKKKKETNSTHCSLDFASAVASGDLETLSGGRLTGRCHKHVPGSPPL